MGKVIELPTRAAQGMAFLEAEIRKLMEDKGESEEAIDVALTTLKDVYSRYGEVGQQSFSVKLPPGLSEEQIDSIHEQITEGISMMTEAHHHIINRLAAELVITKIKMLQTD